MQKAHDFSLPDQQGAIRTLQEFAGKWLVLYFYPQDDTPGCTTEACEFRDDYPALEAAGVAVVGVSKDSVASHAKFAAKYHLNFPLLSDESKAVHEAYGTWGPKKFLGKSYVGVHRSTFLINPAGEIVKTYPDISPKGHARQILEDYQVLKNV